MSTLNKLSYLLFFVTVVLTVVVWWYINHFDNAYYTSFSVRSLFSLIILSPILGAILAIREKKNSVQFYALILNSLAIIFLSSIAFFNLWISFQGK